MDGKTVSDHIEELLSEVEQLKDLVKVLYKKDKERKTENEKLKCQLTTMSREHSRDMQINRGLQRALNKVLIEVQQMKEKRQEGEFEGNDETDTCDTPNSTSGASSLAAMFDQSSKSVDIAERLKLRKNSWFNCRTSTPIPLISGESVVVDDFDEVLTPCQYMDTTTGQYTVPVSGGYRFTIWLRTKGGKGALKAFLCHEKDNEVKKILVDIMEASDGFWHINDVKCDCDKDDGVWVEILRESGDTKVLAEIYGGLDQWY